MEDNWKNNLGRFLQSHHHFCETELNETILKPILEEVVAEFNRFDDFKSFVHKDKKKKGLASHVDVTHFSINVTPNGPSAKFFAFKLDMSFEFSEFMLVIKEASRVIGEHEEKFDFLFIKDIIEDKGILAKLITDKFKSYYENVGEAFEGGRIEMRY
jgi:hypothetical protein